MTEPYLIAHVVRGQPAFDIAIRMCEGDGPCQPNCGLYPNCKDEEMWIIPTSGHRAYPYWSALLDEVALGGTQRIEVLMGDPPPNHPDHYAAHSSPTQPNPLTNLAERLGLVKRPTITRR